MKYLDAENTKGAELKLKEGELQKLKTLKDIAEAKFKALTEFDPLFEDVKMELAPDGMNKYVEEYLDTHVTYADPDPVIDSIELVVTSSTKFSKLNPDVSEFAPRCPSSSIHSGVRTTST